MSKKAEPGGERPPSRGRATPRAARQHNAGAHREAPAAVAAAVAAMHEGAVGSTSSAMAARQKRASHDYVTFQEPGTSEASGHHQGDGRFPGGPGHGGGAEDVDYRAPGTPYYIPAWQRRREPPPERYDERVPGERGPSMEPVGAPRQGPRPTGNGGYRKTNTKIIERVSTIKPDDEGSAPDQAALLPPPPGRNGGLPPQHHDQTTSYEPRLPRQHRPWTPTRLSEGKSPIIISPDRRKRRKRPAAFCFTLCCILFWLAVILIGAAVLTVYLVYRPEPPRLRLTDASLNAGYVDDLTVPGGPPRGLALNADLTVLAVITSPNTKIDVILWYMQMDLYFEGHMIGTQAVRPAPVRETPGGYVLRNVDFVVSEQPLSRQDAWAWRNATRQGGPVVLQLAGRFHTQLNFGHWLPYRYWVNPRCTLWLDPPPSGRLRRAHC
ncbi:unnamed protein product [Alopecurus aequalis]